MKSQERTKLCPNCDGLVAIEVSICPYCGSSVFESNNNNLNSLDDSIKSLSAKETLDSLYPPPYRPKSFEGPEEKPGNGNGDEDDGEPDEDDEGEDEDDGELDEKTNNGLMHTILFWVGVNILAFSIILLLFSKNGELHLKWNANYWFLYSLVGIPLVYFGYRGIKDLT